MKRIERIDLKLKMRRGQSLHLPPGPRCLKKKGRRRRIYSTKYLYQRL
jgi:hypothetical protein